MSDYVAPLADIRFVLEHVADLGDVVATERFAHVDVESILDVLGEVGRFMSEVVAPTNRDGDTIGSRWADGQVTPPPSFRSAYGKWVEAGFGAMPFDPEYGGGGFPWVSAIAVQEMLTSANMALALCPLLTQGAIEAIHSHGSDDQKTTYLAKMLSGEWTGTMNLTEPQAGSDLGAVATRAVPADDVAPGAWRITGQKIFITWGEHDMSDNIVHLVLARTPDSPPGTKGISMFLVPKFFVQADGSLGAHNTVSCVSIEHKVGIHGSPTCTMAYDDAIGWLVGAERDGMRNMFTMMNNARLSVGLQGLSIAERAYQHALSFALERVQGRAVGAAPGATTPIIDHPDVRRMIMTQRAWIDAMRALTYTNASVLDRAKAARSAGDVEASGRWQELGDLLIPLSKSLCTDVGCEMASLAVQVFGGMGYVEETGIGQLFRDIRIAPIYEGTNGIQAADLVGRKISQRGGAVVHGLLDELAARAGQLAVVDGCTLFAQRLNEAVDVTRQATAHLLTVGATDPRTLLAASSPYLRLLGTTVCAGLLAKGALAAAGHDDEFHRGKLLAARFFGEQILPTVVGLAPAITGTADELFSITTTQLASH